ncbi:hypothetical protein [uncultured Algibacter sp.]|uniref:hypothetical protein n=1 Tax=uncultured Algibacter sp. TaxID=298659 RepID=UPI0032165B9B
MKTIFYIMIVLFVGANFTSCSPEALVDQVEEVAINGDDGEIEEEEDDDDGTGN